VFGLMPGTLPLDVDNHRMLIHCIVDNEAIEEHLNDMEWRVAAALRQPIPSAGSGSFSSHIG
jgi:multisubunit Na+/H+ antiporter MnhE subunit